MRNTRTRRLLALVTAAAVLASMSAATVVSPASAAKPKCQGKTATIVGTKKADIIRGTARRDIIVAKGGADRIYAKGGNDLICAGTGNDRVFGGPGADVIWGQAGRDTLNGNAGPDFVAGQVGNDILNGGVGVDTCYQGTGIGSVTNCERPAPRALAPPPPAPTPTPEPGPSPISLDGILAVAYADVNGNHIYDDDDVLISILADGDDDGYPSGGDTITMGKYPTKLDPGAADFASWNDTSHVVAVVEAVDPNVIHVKDGDDGNFLWYRTSALYQDSYFEFDGDGNTELLDRLNVAEDFIRTDSRSPSQPGTPSDFVNEKAPGSGDDRFIDVEINFEAP